MPLRRYSCCERAQRKIGTHRLGSEPTSDRSDRVTTLNGMQPLDVGESSTQTFREFGRILENVGPRSRSLRHFASVSVASDVSDAVFSVVS